MTTPSARQSHLVPELLKFLHPSVLAGVPAASQRLSRGNVFAASAPLWLGSERMCLFWPTESSGSWLGFCTFRNFLTGFGDGLVVPVAGGGLAGMRLMLGMLLQRTQSPSLGEVRLHCFPLLGHLATLIQPAVKPLNLCHTIFTCPVGMCVILTRW